MTTWADTSTRHGTTSGYSLHQSLDEKPCDACVRAKQTYDKRRLAAPEAKRRNRIMANAQIKAYSTLAHRYPDEYRELYERFRTQLLADAGLPYTTYKPRAMGHKIKETSFVGPYSMKLQSTSGQSRYPRCDTCNQTTEKWWFDPTTKPFPQISCAECLP